MTLTVFSAVIFAALLHAGWNALVRGGRDKTTSMAAVVAGQALFGGCLAAVLPLPAPESWPWIASGVILHIGYQFFLSAAYSTGELSEVYPLARGTAPLLVAITSVTILGITLGPFEWMGVILISCGLASLVIVRSNGRFQLPARGTLMALGASVFIAAYSLNDGFGARLSDAPVAFFGWLALINGVVYTSILPFWRPDALRALPGAWPVVVIGGGASFAAYALVVWAFTQAPIATVSALRETSILFALAIGVGLMGEKVNLRRLVAIFLTLLGAIALRLGKSS